MQGVIKCIILCWMPAMLMGQLSSPHPNHSTHPATYSQDSLAVLDTVFSASEDTFYFYPNTGVLYFNDSTFVTLIEDSVYAPSGSFYVRENVYQVGGLNDTIFYVSTPDTLYYYKQYSYFYHHQVFVFNVPQASADTNLGSLLINPPYAGSWAYEWFRYDTSIVDKWTPFASGDSLIEQLACGGYKVALENADNGDDTAFIAWVHNNNLRFNLNLMKGIGDTIDRARFYCGMIFFDGYLRIDSFFYYDPNTDKSYWLEDTARVSWESSCEPVTQPNAYTEDVFVNNMRTVNRVNFNHRSPLPQDTWYYATARDAFGGERTDQLFYKTIETEARMTVIYRAADEDFWTEDGTPEGSGPIRVLFVDESLNAGHSQLVDDDRYQFEQSINILGETHGHSYDFYHIYYVPDEYMPILITSTPEECTDTLRFEDLVTVSPSEIDIPNVFSPNQDGVNDVFTIYSNSLREFEIAIFNRWGKRVYHYDGDINDWEGWNGNMRETGREAMPGEYFYVITAKGWEYEPPVEYKPKNYTGTFYLYR